MIAVSTLLKSCATPPASWPTACIFWAWAKLSRSVLCSVVSRAKMSTVDPSPPRASLPDTKSRTERSAAPPSLASIGGMSPRPCAAAATAARSAVPSFSDTPA